MKSSLPAFALLTLLAAHAAHAQNPLFDALAVPDSFVVPEGRALGSLQIEGELGAGWMKTNNVYMDSSHLSGDALQSTFATTLTSQSETHLVTGTLEHFTQNFRDKAYQNLDISATTATVFGRFVTSDMTNLRLLVIDEEDILGGEQSDQLNGFNSGLEKNRRYEAIFEVANATYFANAMARQDLTDSESFSSEASSVLEEALDRTERDFILLAGRSFGWGKSFLFAGTQAVRYESATDPELAARNSNEKRYGVGIEYGADRLSGDASVYRFSQEFDSPLIRNVDDLWVGSGKLSYAAADSVTLLLNFERRFNETNIANVSGILSENLFVGAAVAFSPALYLRAGPSHSKATIMGTPVQIERYSLDVEAGWSFSEHLQLLFNSSIFYQQPENKAFDDLIAQQAMAVVSLKYSL